MMDMEMDEINLAEMFDPEMIYSNISQPLLLSNYDDDDEQMMSTYINSWDSSYSYAAGQENNNTNDMIIINPNSSSSNPLTNYSSNLTTSQVIDFSSSSSGKDDVRAANDETLSQNKKKVIMCTSTMTGRTTLQARDNVVAERKRRENLGQLFISLSKVVPGLKKLDKASLLEDAVNHLKELQERVSVLEKERSTSTDEYDKSSTADIKARISDKHVLIKIHCKKQNGLMSRVPCLLEKMHLSVVDMRIMPFGGQAHHLHITVLAEMQSEFRGKVDNIVEHLQKAFSKPGPCDL